MLFEIVHLSRYHYSQPVGLEPVTIQLRPRSDVIQTVREHSIKITPEPSGISHCIGLDGNNFSTVWLNGVYDNLFIEVRTLVETVESNPFNFLVTEAKTLTLPAQYSPELMPALQSYLQRDNDAPQVALFAEEIMQATRHETISFLSLLAEQIPTRLEYQLREHGEPWSPEVTLQNGLGSCRDFAMLFVDVCRSVGIAARFVSGYCIGDEAADSHMHAWAEVYLPGAGWRGFDPSRGAATTDDHITVAAGRLSVDAAPISGNFRGVAESSLEVEISINRLE